MHFVFSPPAEAAAGLLDPALGPAAEEWDDDRLTEIPQRGISRHVVRFVAEGGEVFALKEIPERLARREYRLLRQLGRAGHPGGRGARRRRRAPGRPRRRCWSPASSTTPRPSARCSPTRAAAQLTDRLLDAHGRAAGPAAPGRRSCGATARCPTRCSASTPARWPPTWSTPRPPSCTPRCPTGQREYDVDLAHERVGRRADGPAGRRAAGRRTSTRSRSPTTSCARYDGAVGRADRRGGHAAATSSATGSPSGSAGSTSSASTSTRWS